MKLKLSSFFVVSSLVVSLALTACKAQPKIESSASQTPVAAKQLNPTTIVEFPQVEAAIAESEVFFKWLDNNKSYFASCKPKKVDNKIELCDGTTIETGLARKLFKLNAADLVQFIKDKKINLEIHCQDKRKNNLFKKWCKPNVNNSFFNEVSSLHGQYIAYNNTIALHSDAFIGSLVHEYFHYLQFNNSNKVLGHVYKKERIVLQAKLIKAFDQLILDTQVLEKNGQREQAKKSVVQATRLAAALQQFGFWQKLIDERNLFLIFIQFGPELGISQDDIDLARRNMKFLCRSIEFKSLVIAEECL